MSVAAVIINGKVGLWACAAKAQGIHVLAQTNTDEHLRDLAAINLPEVPSYDHLSLSPDTLAAAAVLVIDATDDPTLSWDASVRAMLGAWSLLAESIEQRAVVIVAPAGWATRCRPPDNRPILAAVTETLADVGIVGYWRRLRLLDHTPRLLLVGACPPEAGRALARRAAERERNDRPSEPPSPRATLHAARGDDHHRQRPETANPPLRMPDVSAPRLCPASPQHSCHYDEPAQLSAPWWYLSPHHHSPVMVADASVAVPSRDDYRMPAPLVAQCPEDPEDLLGSLCRLAEDRDERACQLLEDLGATDLSLTRYQYLLSSTPARECRAIFQEIADAWSLRH